MRKIRKIHDAAYSPIADLVTYSPLPTPTLNQIDPFIFLNHHGLQEYPPGNSGLPFGPHPHRGMETVTFIIEGDIMHKDSAGHESVIESGGVQWMTAGRGLIHAEVSSDAFRKKGGKLEILQLWLNLPAAQKMTAPRYTGLQKKDIPSVSSAGGVKVNVIAGEISGTRGKINSLSNVTMSTIELERDGAIRLEVPDGNNVFFYIVRGKLEVNGKSAEMRQLVEFDSAGSRIDVRAASPALVLFGHARPLNEPMVARGPFVMNSEEEIRQAYRDFQEGKFGLWNE